MHRAWPGRLRRRRTGWSKDWHSLADAGRDWLDRGMDRAELSAFLRTRRERLGPGTVGLPDSARRRTPGLRREEVALLAGMSADYYARLEQARGPRPSRQVLTSLARALRLTEDERDHLFRLAGEPAPERTAVSRHVRPGVLYLLDRLTDSAAMVLSELGDVLAWTPLCQALFVDFSALPVEQRNLYRMFFTGPAQVQRMAPEDRERAARAHAADLRAVAARRCHDPAVRALVGDLLAASPLFARLWEEHDVAVRHQDRKRMVHPVVGELWLDCEVLLTPAQDQRLVLHTAPPGSESAEKLALLRVIGLQQLTPNMP
ncbi:helix-turn-helix transcriptional regulator [Kutzneria viridogrisea]|uniref:Transcriptional regulator with XRE-family HTH domain n=1 Tax=Kutzneria viridogrisea TaxID=47990 RepID=A0ABR6BHC8_9PSEU|nr:transcriptional regulator with XRE-family HTH domain [Kutzneria viridogrisea]